MGLYPGGPRQFDSTARSEVLANARIGSVAEFESQRFSGPQAARLRNRQQRMIVGGAVAVFLAVGTGYWLGESHQITESAAINVSATQGEDRIAEERDRILRELWKMEAVEHAGRRSR